jgi:cysteine desulfurase
MEPIYLDFNATTPLDREAAEEMRLYIDEFFGNPSSSHSYGIKARQAVELARKRLASLLNCSPDEIVFTSGGTESNNYAIKGAALARRNRGSHIITSAIEHPSVLEVCRYLEKEGFSVTYVGVDGYGMTDPAEIEAAITPQTILITIMHSNNEVGTIQPVGKIAAIASRHGILFHTDAAQSIGKIPVDMQEFGVDLLSVAGHKFYAPKGIGALYIRSGVEIEKLIHGADHERNHRAGTENVIEIAGIGKAAEVAEKGMEGWVRRCRSMRDRLHSALAVEIPGIRLNGHPELRLPNTLSLSFPGADAQAMLSGMKEVAASAGAACHADQVAISGVLAAMKVPAQLAIGTIRFSVGRTTTEEEIDRAAKVISSVYSRLSAGTSESGPGIPSAGIRLTEYTHSLGCACKIRPQSLEKILAGLPRSEDLNLLVGTETSDDAAVYRISDDIAIVQTVDFIPPVVDDPYTYGAIAAANALSDIYAMGGKPMFALSVVGFPEKVLPLDVLQEIIRGAADKVAEAGIQIAGGHSIEDSEPKFGLVVTGRCHPDRILRNRGARPGDVLVLTKPIGVGILTTAMKRGYASREAADAAIRSMSELNRQSAELLSEFDVHACTDITGFGLLGHLKEMIAGSNTDAEISFARVPLLSRVTEYAEAGMVPGGSLNNLSFVSDILVCKNGISDTQKKILADAQTSGGLLVSMAASDAEKFIKTMPASEGLPAAVIGKIVEGSGRILVVL